MRISQNIEFQNLGKASAIEMNSDAKGPNQNNTFKSAIPKNLQGAKIPSDPNYSPSLQYPDDKYYPSRTETGSKMARKPSSLPRFAALLTLAAAGAYFTLSPENNPFHKESAPQLAEAPPTASSQNSTGTAANTATPTSTTAAGGVRKPAQQSTILLRINAAPITSESTVTLSGRRLDPRNLQVAIALDTSLELTIETPKYRPLHREFSVTTAQVGGLKEWQMDIQLDPLEFGFISISSTPSALATIIPIESTNRKLASDSRKWVLKTPVENEKLPSGLYEVKLENKLLGMEKIFHMEIKDGKTIKRTERLDLKP